MPEDMLASVEIVPINGQARRLNVSQPALSRI
jgi:DNA-binding transcriptional LysR family regulator